MYIIEWYDHEGNRHEQAFDSREVAHLKVAELEREFDRVAVLWEAEI